MNGMKDLLHNGLEKGQDNQRLNLLVYTPGIFKRTFKEGLDGVLRKYRDETGNDLKIYGPMEWPYDGNDEYEDIWKTTDIDRFPDVVAAMGFGNFLRNDFIDRFVRKGYFQTAWDRPVGEPFEKAGFMDPNGWYTVYSVVPFVMLVDREKLGGLKAPEQWKDLLGQRFRDNVIISSTGNGAANVPLLYIYKEFGEEGIMRFADNIKAIWPAARIAKQAGLSNMPGAAVYVVSWFFARSCPRTETTSIVWPEDGAVTSPLYLLVKKSKASEMSAIIRYITGAPLGEQSAGFCLPVLNPDVNNGLPENASFNWIGWNYIQSHDTAELREYSQALFMSKWKNSQNKRKNR